MGPLYSKSINLTLPLSVTTWVLSASILHCQYYIVNITLSVTTWVLLSESNSCLINHHLHHFGGQGMLVVMINITIIMLINNHSHHLSPVTSHSHNHHHVGSVGIIVCKDNRAQAITQTFFQRNLQITMLAFSNHHVGRHSIVVGKRYWA